MKAIMINGSARKDGNTVLMLQYVADELNGAGIETELTHLAGKPVRGCLACYQCFKKKDRRCSNDQDVINSVIEKMIEADAMVLGSPTYFSNVSAEMKALIDRAGLVARANGDLFQRKVGAAVVAVRRAGSLPVFDAINRLFLIGQMVVPGSSYWNLGVGREKGEVEKDEEGVATMRTLGKNMAWVMGQLAKS